MKALWAALTESVRAALGLLRTPAFYLLLLAAVGAWVAAYQQKRVYTVVVGGLEDDAYVAGFHDKEKTPAFPYRWTEGLSTVVFPGIGNEPVELSLVTSGSRPDLPPPVITVTARGLDFPIQTQPQLHTDTLSLPRGNLLEDDLTVRIEAPTFNVERTTQSRGRDLGVTVLSVSVAPAGYGLRPLVAPPPGAVLSMVVALALFCLSICAATRRRELALGVGALLAGAATVLTVAARPELGLLAPQLPALGLWCLGLAVAGRGVLASLLTDGTAGARYAVAAGAAAFVLAFALRYGGLTYPQFRTSDLVLNIHNVEAVLGGDWVFTEPLPDGTPGPYPPALYAAVLPFTWLLGASEETIGLLLKWLTATLDAAGCLGAAWAAHRLWRGRAGGYAALLYAVSPAPFELFSAGNYTNLFAQGTLNFALLGGLVYLHAEAHRPAMQGAHRASSPIRRRWGLLLFVGGAFLLTALGHYGMMLAVLAVVGLFLLWTVVAAVRGWNVTRSVLLLMAVGASFALAFAVYYRHQMETISNHLGGLAERLLTGGPSRKGGASPAPRVLISKLGGKIARVVGTAQLLMALTGLLRLWPLRVEARAWLCSWLLVAGGFALLDQVVGDAVRWYYLAAAAIALLGGRFLGLLASRGMQARLLGGLVVLMLLQQLLWTWVGDLIFVRYH